MSNEILNQLIFAFGEPHRVTNEVLLTASSYFEMYKHGHADHPYPELADALNKETIDEDSVRRVKDLVIAYASQTPPPPLFATAVEVLRQLRDPALVPLLIGWLNRHLRRCVDEGCTLHALLIALEDCGEAPYSTSSRSILDIDDNVADARRYLKVKLGINSL